MADRPGGGLSCGPRAPRYISRRWRRPTAERPRSVRSPGRKGRATHDVTSAPRPRPPGLPPAGQSQARSARPRPSLCSNREPQLARATPPVAHSAAWRGGISGNCTDPAKPCRTSSVHLPSVPGRSLHRIGDHRREPELLNPPSSTSRSLPERLSAAGHWARLQFGCYFLINSEIGSS